MFILYFALWVILNGRWTTEIGVLGVLFAAVMYVFSCKFIGFSLSVDFQLFRRIPSAIGYGFTLLKEIVKANIAVLKLILDKNFEPKPQLVHFDAVLRRDRHLVTLAKSTIEANRRFFEGQEERMPTHAYTMGIRSILRAKKILVAVSGEDKADAVRRVFFGPVTPEVPGSILQLHDDVTLVADEAAYSKCG